MTPEERIYIENYLNNQISPEVKLEFEARLKSDSQFVKRVDLVRLERISVELLKEQDLRKKMVEWKAEPSKRGRKFKMLFLILGVLLVIFGVSYIIFIKHVRSQFDNNYKRVEDSIFLKKDSKKDTIVNFKNPIAHSDSQSKEHNSENNNSITDISSLHYRDLALAQYEKISFQSFIDRSNDMPKSQSFEHDIAGFFNRNDFEGALNYISNNPSKDTAYMYYLRGHAYFNLKNFTESATNFKQSITTVNLERRERAYWFWALSLLANNQKSESLIILRKIVTDEDALYYVKAKQIIETIDSEK